MLYNTTMQHNIQQSELWKRMLCCIVFHLLGGYNTIQHVQAWQVYC